LLWEDAVRKQSRRLCIRHKNLFSVHQYSNETKTPTLFLADFAFRDRINDRQKLKELMSTSAPKSVFVLYEDCYQEFKNASYIDLEGVSFSLETSWGEHRFGVFRIAMDESSEETKSETPIEVETEPETEPEIETDEESPLERGYSTPEPYTPCGPPIWTSYGPQFRGPFQPYPSSCPPPHPVYSNQSFYPIPSYSMLDRPMPNYPMPNYPMLNYSMPDPTLPPMSQSDLSDLAPLVEFAEGLKPLFSN